MGVAEELVADIRGGLLRWYDFQPGARALYIGSEEDGLYAVLCQADLHVEHCSMEQVVDSDWGRAHQGVFQYIISVEDLERTVEPVHYLEQWKRLLSAHGRLLLGLNNRLGIRYFCGDRDPYTGRNFDGIENYFRAYGKREDVFQGRMYSQAEIRQLLRDSGWETVQFFSILPDLKNPSFVFAEGYYPNEDLASRVFPTYNAPDTVFLEEERLYDTLLQNGMFHKMANTYLVECSLDAEESDVQQVTSSLDRGRSDALLTILHRSDRVEKRAAFPEGKRRLQELVDHAQDLKAHGIAVVEATIKDGAYVMPFVHAEGGQLYLGRLLMEDTDRFLREMDRFRDLILQSSEHIREDEGDGQGVWLRKGYLDMVPLNTFFVDGQFVFYDQEFCEENYPANVILLRAIKVAYTGNLELQKKLPMEAVMQRYDLCRCREQWEKMEWEFICSLRKEQELRFYHAACRRNPEVVNSNRQRLNFSAEAYQRLFIDIFGGLGNRKVILFGSGRFAQRFLTLYGEDYPVSAVLDNQKTRWGTTLGDVTIQSPEMLSDLSVGTYRVIICIKNYLSVVQQLKQMGIQDYAIFDPNRDYPRKHKPVLAQNNQTAEPVVAKKYHVGYIAGVFDLFHVGHLNMFKRAREQCDYLIVGVVSDEGVRKFKKTEPFIPFEERIEMVRSCRYVDEARKIPLDYAGTRDAWRMYHFDVQFSGSDYVDNPDWLAEKEFLQKRGADLVFFPYTEQTSSTKIKALIQEKLV